MSRPFRFDWPTAYARIIEAGEDPASICLYCIPRAGALLLVAVMERLRWEASYRVEDYDFSDWEYLQDIVDNTEVGLSMNCDDILNEISQTVTTIINNQTTQVLSQEGICCYLENQPVNEPDPDGGPILPGGPRAELCKSAQKAHDNGSAFLNEIFNYGIAGAGVSAGTIAFLIGLYAISLPAALLFTLIGLIVAVITDLSTDQVKADWVTVKPDIVCAIYTADGPGDAKTAVHNVIDNASILGASKSLFKALYNQGQINKIWDNGVGDTTGYSSAYCNACGEGTAFTITFTFDADREEWGPGGEMGWYDIYQAMLANTTQSSSEWMQLANADIWTLSGHQGADRLAIDRITADFTNLDVDNPPNNVSFVVTGSESGAEEKLSALTGSTETLEYDELFVDIENVILTIRCNCYAATAPGGGPGTIVDNINIYGRAFYD